MRVAVLSSVLLAACTPEIATGSYFCGPDSTCPEGQACNPADHTCTLAGIRKPFECEADLDAEPDDSPALGYTLGILECTMLPVVIAGCMFIDDPADWVRLPIPADCGTVEIDARISYPVAFQQLGLSLIDTTSGVELATDEECVFQSESGDDLRCLAASLTGGVTYAIGVSPTGDGDCDGDCAFNRYTLRAQLK